MNCVRIPDAVLSVATCIPFDWTDRPMPNIMTNKPTIITQTLRIKIALIWRKLRWKYASRVTRATSHAGFARAGSRLANASAFARRRSDALASPIVMPNVCTEGDKDS